MLLLIYYALPVVCTSRYILLAKRSILTAIVTFERSDFGFAMDQPIVKVDRMEEGR